MYLYALGLDTAKPMDVVINTSYTCSADHLLHSNLFMHMTIWTCNMLPANCCTSNMHHICICSRISRQGALGLPLTVARLKQHDTQL